MGLRVCGSSSGARAWRPPASTAACSSCPVRALPPPGRAHPQSAPAPRRIRGRAGRWGRRRATRRPWRRRTSNHTWRAGGARGREGARHGSAGFGAAGGEGGRWQGWEVVGAGSARRDCSPGQRPISRLPGQPPLGPHISAIQGLSPSLAYASPVRFQAWGGWVGRAEGGGRRARRACVGVRRAAACHPLQPAPLPTPPAAAPPAAAPLAPCPTRAGTHQRVLPHRLGVGEPQRGQAAQVGGVHQRKAAHL